MSKDVTAICQRSGNWWAIETPEIPGLYTQARRLDQAEHMVKDAAQLLGVDVDTVTILPFIDTDTESLIEQLLSARAEATRAQERASQLTREAISTLRNEGLTVRDVAIVTGLSPQRVSALQAA